MSDRAALRSARRPWKSPAPGWLAAAALAVALAGCSQPGTQAPLSAAKKLDEATTAISVSCGYASQMTAFGKPRASELRTLQGSAAAGARKLAAVYARVSNDIYQGETVKSIVADSISLLGECGLDRARGVLQPGAAGKRWRL